MEEEEQKKEKQEEEEEDEQHGQQGKQDNAGRKRGERVKEKGGGTCPRSILYCGSQGSCLIASCSTRRASLSQHQPRHSARKSKWCVCV
eukprot:3882012-Rhodomonas_salina.1